LVDSFESFLHFEHLSLSEVRITVIVVNIVSVDAVMHQEIYHLTHSYMK